MTEKLIEKNLVSRVKAKGGLALKFHSSSHTGMPDRLVLIKGETYWVELKTTGKKPSPIQLVAHRLLDKLGFPVYVIDSAETLDTFIFHII